jgi:hypothetical protein
MMSCAEIEAALRGSGELELQIVRDVGRFTVALFPVYDHSDGGDRVSPPATGTLVSVKKAPFILTAAHVWDTLKSASKVGITLVEGMPHRFLIDTKTIEATVIARAEAWDQWGPDMALLCVPLELVSEISAHRTFYDAAVDGKLPPDSAPDVIEVKLIMGTPEKSGTFTDEFASVNIEGHFVNSDGTYETHGEYDYYSAILYTESGIQSFRGMSGGGLWNIQVYCSAESGKIEWSQTLVGIAFYELDVTEEGKRTIRCHGPKSIEKLLT